MLTRYSFGQWLLRRRKALDLTREELAFRVGCSAAMIRKIESEERRPSAQIVERLAEALKISKDERSSFLLFARGDWQYSPGEPMLDLPWRVQTAEKRVNLPFTTSSIIGREKDIALVSNYLSDNNIRFVTLTGPPGIGKTRLSIEVARSIQHNHPDGIFFVSLAALDNPTLVASAIIQALGFVETKGISAKKLLIDGISNKQILLILDDCEHYVNEIALIASELLLSCSHLKILVTSRESLRVPGEWIYTVPSLAMQKNILPKETNDLTKSPAMMLFIERARAVRSDFEINAENIKDIASICAQLDGLPLALELIAARIRVMSPKALLNQLTDAFILSADGMRAVSNRQKTLNNAIDWSFNTLSPDEQMLFAFLSVFSGDFLVESCNAIFSEAFSGTGTQDLIYSLSDKSLLQRTFIPGGDVGFRMLATVQLYALNKLRQMDMENQVRDWHLDYFLNLAELGDNEIRGPSQAEWGNKLEREHDNFRSALEWCVKKNKTEQALRLLNSLGWIWEVHGHYYEARSWFEKICSLPNVNNYQLIFAKLLNHIGRHCWTQENYLDANLYLEKSKEISSSLGHDGEQYLAETLNWLALLKYFHDNDQDQAKSLLGQGLNLYQKLGDQKGVALTTFHLGIVESYINDDYAQALLQQSLDMFTQFGDQFFIARVSLFIGYIYLRKEDFEKARYFFEKQLRIDQRLHFWDGITDGWRNLGFLYRKMGLYDDAEQNFDESLTICNEHGLFKFESYFFSGLLALYRGDHRKTFGRFTYLLKHTQKSGEDSGVGDLLTVLSAAAAANNQFDQAARLSGAASSLISKNRSRYQLEGDEVINNLIRSSRQELSDEIYSTYETEGKNMTFDQAISFALKGNTLVSDL